MDYIIEYKGQEIAAFADRKDAEDFCGMKREQLLQQKNDSILDKIAEEMGLDRSSPGMFPLGVTMLYYDAAREQIKKECVLIEKTTQEGEKPVRKVRITDMDIEHVIQLAAAGAELVAEDGHVYQILGEKEESNENT